VIAADDFIEPLRARGFDFWTGVPCSFLTPLINRVIGAKGLSYVGAASEGEAVGIAAGAWLAGRQSVVMCQNSGLGNTVNPLTSLNFPFRIPTLMVVTWRGQPGIKDEPQHELMGLVTASLLDTIRVPHAAFPAEPGQVPPALDQAFAAMTSGELPYAFIMPQGSVRDDGLSQTALPTPPAGERLELRQGGALPTRAAALERILAAVPESAALIATTGKAGRELFTLSDRPQHLYLVGSMGCASGVGLGVALNTERPVVVLDGDGAALMKLGTLATVGAMQPRNLMHVVLDNGVHDSTGGQATVSPVVDFAAVALACGYARAASCDSLSGLDRAMAQTRSEAGPTLIHIKIAPGSMEKLGRPTVTPYDVARRFQAFVTRS
jgi:phosphonopyruvate decarboxylase